MATADGSDLSVAVVVPCHNYGRFLGEAMASLFAQSRPADEIVVVDDGSTDETSEVMAGLVATHPELRTVSRCPARGAVATFNDGIALTTSDLLVVFSADDRLGPTYLEALSAAFVAPRIGFAYPETHLFGTEEGLWPARPFDVRRLARRNFVSGAAMFRRTMYDEIGGFDERFATLGKEDWAFFLRAVSLGWTGVPVSACFHEYRQHSTTSRNVASLADLLRTRLLVRKVAPGTVGPLDLALGALDDLRRITRGRLQRRVHPA